MAVYGGQYTITGTATSLTTILTAIDAKFPAGGTQFRELHLVNGPAATQTFYLGRSNVTNAPTNAIALVGPAATGGLNTQTFGNSAAHMEHTNNLFIVGTAGAAEFALIMIIS